MNDLIKVKDSVGLVRDVKSRAIMNTSSVDYDKYMQRRNAILKEKQEVAVLKKEVTEIKDMLAKILEKIT
jgi:recombinational DNA repair ATPase RecF